MINWCTISLKDSNSKFYIFYREIRLAFAAILEIDNNRNWGSNIALHGVPFSQNEASAAGAQ